MRMKKNEEKFWVYILENPSGGFYIGQTSNLQKRVSEHNTSVVRSKYTAKHGPWRLVWSECFSSRSRAMLLERQIKKMKSAEWIRKVLLNRKSVDG